jgi:hypothetical protein
MLPWLALASTGRAMPSTTDGHWRAAFESSPRAGLNDEQFKALIDRIKVPPEIAEKSGPSPSRARCAIASAFRPGKQAAPALVQ